MPLENCKHNPDGWCLACVRAERLLYTMERQEIEQVLGKALGYPWFKDDPKNFPNATADDGVCVGDNVPITLALEAAAKLNEFQVLGEQLCNNSSLCEHPSVFSCEKPITRCVRGILLSYACTRAVGHTGPHIACGTKDHNIITWTEPKSN